MKRFYKHATWGSGTNGFHILLDGKPVKTPEQAPLLAPNSILAEAIAHEWNRQGDTIQPETMPITQWLITQIDRVMPQRSKLSDDLLGYIDTDLLCYRADCDSDIGKLQAATWNPVLDWISKAFGVAPLTTTTLESLQQPPPLHQAIKTYVAALPDSEFTALYVITSGTGSLFLGLSLLQNAFDAGGIYAAARVEENYKKTLYHEDIHGSAPDQEKREAKLREDLDSARLFLDLAAADPS